THPGAYEKVALRKGPRRPRSMARDYVPILMLMAAAVGIAAAILLLSAVLGPRLRTRSKLETYESGVPLLDISHKRLSIKFFVIAIVFILFDVEIAFLYPWAVIFRTGGPGLFLEMLAFLAVLAVGYAYIWRKGAFDL
ncbi:MAG TPA: NADH-quinone oxidoreductase subunit A, partial [Thermoanaerobaculia bacterium]